MGVSGRDKHGEMVSGKYEQSLFYLSIDERVSIFRLCAPVHAIVSGRMSRISGIPFEIVCNKTEEDRDAERLKNLAAVFKEYSGAEDIKYQVAAGRMRQLIMEVLPDVLPDLSNFEKALYRWKKRLDVIKVDRGEEIKHWLMQPNQDDNWEDFIKKYIFDLMIHGQAVIYKEALHGKIENFYIMPGGTVMPLKDRFLGGATAYVQIISGYEPKIYFSDEVCYSRYIPSSARAYGMVPLECLVNKVAETMFFDKLMAEQADGTKLPEKMIVVADNSPFGAAGDSEFKVPMDVNEQTRLETKANTPKRGAIMTFSGNTVTVVDLSRENTMALQTERQKDVRNEVALVFAATPMEVNLANSEGTSGRSTAEAQQEIMHQRGVLPLLQQIERAMSDHIIPFRFGWGYRLEYDTGRDEKEELDILVKKMQTGLFSVNEIRIEDLNKDPFDGKQYNEPSQAQQPQPGSSPDTAMFTRNSDD
jgi:phage portal protein BeeE